MENTFCQWLDRKRKKAEAELEKCEKIANLKQKYPDLDKHERLHTVMIVSKTINGKAEDCEFISSCGCCPDAAELAFPYTIENDIKIYSNPPSFVIGNMNQSGFGIIENQEWEETMKKENVSSVVVEKARKHLENNPPIDEGE